MFKMRKIPLKWPKAWSTCAIRKGQKIGVEQPGEGSRETSEILPVTKGASRELERDLGQEGMTSHCQRAGLDSVLGRNSLF